MKRVEIYDQYSNVYANANNGGALEAYHVMPNETLPNYLTLVHSSESSVTVEASGLDNIDAINFVNTLYQQSKGLGSSYDDKLIKLDEGYAELRVFFPDGRQMNRVIYTVDE